MKPINLFKQLLHGGTIFHFDLRSSSVATRQTENEFSFALAAPSVPFSIFHLNGVWGRLLLLLLFILTTIMNAKAQEAYAVYTEDNTTLTFYYDNLRSTRTGTTYDLNTGWNSPGWYSNRTSVATVVFDSSFADARPTCTYQWFCGMNNLTTITDIGNLNTSEVTEMSQMFNTCTKLTSIDVSHFDTKNVIYAASMFQNCKELTSLNLSNFNTENVIDMNRMFYGCNKLASLDVSSFNTENVTNMSYMFANCLGLTTLDLNNFNTSAVTNMSFMFQGCTGLTSFDLSSFNTANVTNMSSMFYWCTSLTTLDLSSFNTANATNMSYMFNGCSSLVNLDISNFNTSKVANMTGMFSDCSRLTNINLRNFNTANVTSMETMFSGCSGLTSLDLSNFDTGEVAVMSQMFQGCSGLTSLDLSNFNTSNVTTMKYMFSSCSGLTSLDLSSFNTAKVADMSYMFQSCRSLTSLDLSNFNTSNVTTMKYMFSSCSGLTSLDLSNFNTANVTNMNSMFTSCSGLTSLDLSNFNATNVADMSYMFQSCSGLTSLDLSSFNTIELKTMESMFMNCSSLRSLNLSGFNTEKLNRISSMFYNCSELETIYVDNGWKTDNVATGNSENMFYGCSSLVGGKGTCYSSIQINKSRAHIDGGETNPGYFTELDVTQAYSVYDASNMTLAFYYDKQRASRGGEVLRYGTNDPAWYDNRASVTAVVFDASFADARPTSTYKWFEGMTNLTSIDLSKLNTSNVSNMSYLFNGCTGLTAIFVGDGWSTENVTSSDNMFTGCTSLVGGLGTIYDANHVNKEYAHIDGGEATPGYFTDPDANQAYTVYDADNTTLTFYYDKQRVSRGGDILRYGNRYPAWYDYRASVTAVVFDASFADARPTTTYSWFKMENLTSITGIEYLNTSEVTNMRAMFMGCSELTSLDVSGFVTDKVTDMYGMFTGCFKVNSLNLSNFNTSEVTNMYGMFTSCMAIANLDLSSFNTSKVIDMDNMFESCSSLTSLDLSSFNTSNVTNMSGMFNDCTNLTTIFVDDSWSTASVTSSENMFAGCTKLVGGQGTKYNANYTDASSAHIDDGSGYLTDKEVYWSAPYVVIDGTTLTFYNDGQRSSRTMPTHSLYTTATMPSWYDLAPEITEVVFDDSFASARPTSTYGWLCNMGILTTITNFSNLNTSEVTNMGDMFCGCNLLTSLDLSNFNTAKVTDMNRMFYFCNNLETIFVGSNWTTANVTDSEVMFVGCTNLVGGMGTTYDTNHVDKEYARVDNAPESPGYFTDPNNIIDPNAPYAVLVEDGKTLQFRNDGQRLTMPNLKTYNLNTGSNRPGWVVDGSNAAITTVTFLDSFASARPTSMHSWFEGMTNLTRVWNPEYLNTSEVTDMANLFKDCSKLTSDKFDISGFTTTQVRDMSSMFEGCVMATVIDVSHFDTHNVTDMANMFSGCIRLTTLNVAGLNTAKVTDMGKMFYDCGGYAGTLGTLDVTSFDTRLVTDMNGMFYHVTARVDVTGFDTQNVTDMHEMFKNVSAETLDLRSFNTSKVTDMSGMFERNFNLTTITVGSGWTVANVTSSENMFDLCGRLCGDKGTSYEDANPKDKTYAHLDGGTADPGYLTDVNGPYAALSQDGKTLTFYKDGQRLTRTEKTYSLNAGIFANPGWTTDGSNATIESVVFDESFADARPASTMGWFSGMTSLTSLTGMENLNASEVTLMSSMFYHCTGLTSIDLSHLNTAKVTAMTSMFNGCTGLTTLDLMTFDTGNVTSMSYMFYGCSNLTTIYAGGGWSTAKVDEESSGHMFDGCTSLVGGMGTTYDESCVDKAYARLDGGADSPGYFSSTPAYAALSEDGKTLTFYCDMLRSTRGKTYDLNGPGDVDDTEWYNDGSYSDITTVVFDASFASARPLGTTSWFQELENLTSIIGMEYLNTSEVTDMSFMFQNCLSLTSLDLSHFDTGKVTNMRSMFNCCSVLTSLDLSSFNTENVTDMGYMFAQCYSLTSIAVGHLNTTKVKYMDKMFFGCSGLTSIDFTGFGFQTGSVTDMCNMFDGCSKLTYLNTSKAFKYGTQNVTDMSYMFRGCSSLTSLNLQPLNTPMVTNMSYMFQGCSSLTELTLNSYYFMTKNVTTMAHMFDGCSVLTSLDVSGFNTSKVTDMSYMFNGCQALKSLDFSNFNTANLTTMNRMFMNCRSLKTLDLSSFNTDNVKNRDMDWLFGMCSSLERVDVSNFNTSGLTGLWSMFIGCSSLKSLDLTSFNTAKVTLTTTMFQDCSNLKTVYVGDGWDMSKVTTSPGMFSGCTSIVGGMGTTFDENHVDKAYAHIDGGTSNPGYFTEKPAFLLGDVNGDGKVDVADITALTNYLIAYPQPLPEGMGDGYNLQAADVDGSGEVTSADVPALVNLILGQ